MKKGTFIVLTLMLLASTGVGQKGRISHTIELTPTDHGQPVFLHAQATKGLFTAQRKGAELATEVFAVQVYADMKDEEVIQVLIDTTSGQTDLPVGTFALSNGSGTLILMNRASFWSDQPGNLPVFLSEIKTVKLVHQEDTMAIGSFNNKIEPAYRDDLEDRSEVQGIEADAISQVVSCRDLCRQQLVTDREHCATLQPPANYSCWLRAQQNFFRCRLQCLRPE